MQVALIKILSKFSERNVEISQFSIARLLILYIHHMINYEDTFFYELKIRRGQRKGMDLITRSQIKLFFLSLFSQVAIFVAAAYCDNSRQPYGAA